MKKVFQSVICLVALVLLCSCTTHMADLAVLTDKQINTKNLKVSKLTQNKNVLGKSQRTVVLFIPFGIPSIKEALDSALDENNGDLMLDVSIDKSYWCALFYGKWTYEVKGTVVNTQERIKK